MTRESFPDLYRRIVGEEPPQDFISIYSILCEALYFGAGPKDFLEQGKRRNSKHSDYFFADHRLLKTKKEVDRRLAAMEKALRRWEKKSAAADRARPEETRGAGRARSRQVRSAPRDHQEEA